MTAAHLKSRLAGYATSNAVLVVIGFAVTVLVVVLLPARNARGVSADPARDAQQAYYSLMQQIGESDSNQDSAVSESPRSSLYGDSTRPAIRVTRDLFAPVLRVRDDSVLSGTREAGSRRGTGALLLTGVFIDGFSRQAVISGSVVTEGEVIRGYRVVEIAPQWVIVEKDASTVKLILGGKP